MAYYARFSAEINGKRYIVVDDSIYNAFISFEEQHKISPDIVTLEAYIEA